MNQHQYYVTEMVNPIKIQQEALKRLKEKGQTSTIHYHSTSVSCGGNRHLNMDGDG